MISRVAIAICAVLLLLPRGSDAQQVRDTPGPRVCLIDGQRVPGRLCTILAHDRIDRIEILRGDAAASRFGSEAADGAILITTKDGSGPLPSEDPLARHLFPPELVMANQQAIQLTESQRNAIQDAMRRAQSDFVGLQFRMSGLVEQMQQLLAAPRVDEAKVLEQVDRVLATEREIKRAQLSLMVRVKNQLTEQQQAALNRIRSPGRDRP